MAKTLTVTTEFHYTKDELPDDGSHVITETGCLLYYDGEEDVWIFDNDWDNPSDPPEMWAYIPVP